VLPAALVFLPDLGHWHLFFALDDHVEKATVEGKTLRVCHCYPVVLLRLYDRAMLQQRTSQGSSNVPVLYPLQQSGKLVFDHRKHVMRLLQPFAQGRLPGSQQLESLLGDLMQRGP
jgi:hypothetical protein